MSAAVVKMHYCDEAALPEWGTGPDGRPTKIVDDERLTGLYLDWQADACGHEHVVTTCELDSLGREQYFERCNHCGLKLTGALAHTAARGRALSDISKDGFEGLARKYIAERRERLDAIARAAAERCQPLNRSSYDDYLRSSEWKRRAAKIIERAEGKCEGCLTNAADEVHHLTYEHLGAEFAFELVALCSPCHRRWHSRKAA